MGFEIYLVKRKLINLGSDSKFGFGEFRWVGSFIFDVTLPLNTVVVFKSEKYCSQGAKH
jgi:hypothetical protein